MGQPAAGFEGLPAFLVAWAGASAQLQVACQPAAGLGGLQAFQPGGSGICSYQHAALRRTAEPKKPFIFLLRMNEHLRPQL